MPQMAPAWWTILFLTFILSFLTMFYLLYFQTYDIPEPQSKDKMMMSKMNWKW